MLPTRFGVPSGSQVLRRRLGTVGGCHDSGASVLCFKISEEIRSHPTSTLLQEAPFTRKRYASEEAHQPDFRRPYRTG
jgi:hypothetical protein